MIKMIILLLVILLILTVYTKGFNIYRTINSNRKNDMKMKWSFQQRPGLPTMPSDINNNVGLEGELYYTPTKIATLKTPLDKKHILSKTRTIPIFPGPNLLVPGGTDWLNVFEMKHRQLLNNVGDGVFGFSYLSQQQQKLSLVGTLARIQSRKILEDGRSFVVVEGLERFYIQEIITDKPYLTAKIQTFKDYTEESADLLDKLENEIFNDVRCNVKLMQLLFPQKNYTLNPNLLINRPPLIKEGVRNVIINDETIELDRRSRFSFVVMDMLQISPATKISLLQEHVLEKRYARFLKIIEKGSSYLKSELRNKGVLTEPGIQKLYDDLLRDDAVLNDFPKSAWAPENYVQGNWVLMPTLMN